MRQQPGEARQPAGLQSLCVPRSWHCTGSPLGGDILDHSTLASNVLQDTAHKQNAFDLFRELLSPYVAHRNCCDTPKTCELSGRFFINK